MDAGLLLARLMLGLALSAHGAQKLFGIFSVHWPHGFFASSNGIELPFLYLTAALALISAGSGAYSLDELLSVSPLFPPASAWTAIAVAVGLALLNLALRRAPATAARTHA